MAISVGERGIQIKAGSLTAWQTLAARVGGGVFELLLLLVAPPPPTRERGAEARNRKSLTGCVPPPSAPPAGGVEGALEGDGRASQVLVAT